jgi:hypothetical protein
MCTKWLKSVVIVLVVGLLVGGLVFGGDLVSYLRSSAKSVQTAVKGSVPIDFELCRARDLLEEIIPEMHANIQLIAQEEVEVAALKTDIAQSEKNLGDEKTRVSKLHDSLNQQLASYTIGSQELSREQLKEELSRRFDRFKEANVVLESKKRLLSTREKSLLAANQLLEKTRHQKMVLEDKIETLDSQHRLVKAASVGSNIHVDNSKLAQTEKLIAQIKKRLDVAERVLAHESRFVQPLEMETVTETELLSQIDEYFHPSLANSQPENTTAETGKVCLDESSPAEPKN